MAPDRLTFYLALIEAFVCGRLPPSEFEQRYLRAFKAEDEPIEPAVYSVLEPLFSDIDAYSPECPPGEETDFTISEAQLRDQAARALEALRGQPAVS